MLRFTCVKYCYWRCSCKYFLHSKNSLQICCKTNYSQSSKIMWRHTPLAHTDCCYLQTLSTCTHIYMCQCQKICSLSKRAISFWIWCLKVIFASGMLRSKYYLKALLWRRCLCRKMCEVKLKPAWIMQGGQVCCISDCRYHLVIYQKCFTNVPAMHHSVPYCPYFAHISCTENPFTLLSSSLLYADRGMCACK